MSDYVETTTAVGSARVRVDSTHCPNQSEHSVALEQVQKTSIGVAFLLALVLNGFLLGTLLHMSRVRNLNRMHRMIVHLTCADLFVAFCNILPHFFIIHQRGVIYGGPFVCAFVPYIQVLSMYSSSYVLIAASIDRFLAICHPLRFHASIVARQPFLVVAAWVASSILAGPQTLVLNSTSFLSSDGVQLEFCSYMIVGGLQRVFYISYHAVTIYLAPVLIIGGLNTRICLVVWRNSAHAQPETGSMFVGSTAEEIQRLRERSEKGGSPLLTPNARMEGERENGVLPRMHLQRMSKAKVKTVKLTLAIVVSYFLCWGPFFICSVLVAWDPCRFNQASVPDRALVVLIMDMASLNSCVNPFICLLFNKHFRDHVTCRHSADKDTTAQSTNFASSLRSTLHVPSRTRRSSYPARRASAVDLAVYGCGRPTSMEASRLRVATQHPRLSC